MCKCALSEGIHWYVERIYAPYMYLVAKSPEEAEHSLRNWAARILSVGHNQLDIRQMAGRVLAVKILNMQSICQNVNLRHPSDIWID